MTVNLRNNIALSDGEVNSGFNAFLHKPFHEQEFFSIIQQSLPEPTVAVNGISSGEFSAIATNSSSIQKGKEGWTFQLNLYPEKWVNELKELALLYEVNIHFHCLSSDRKR